MGGKLARTGHHQVLTAPIVIMPCSLLNHPRHSSQSDCRFTLRNSKFSQIFQNLLRTRWAVAKVCGASWINNCPILATLRRAADMIGS